MPLPEIYMTHDDIPPAPSKETYCKPDPGWDAEAFFRKLHSRNRMCRKLGFTFGSCAGLQGLYDALAQAGNSPNFMAIDDSSEGYVSLHNSPYVRSVKTVFISMRHKAGNMKLREQALSVMREIFRQFMTILIKERVKLEENNINIDPRIQFNEIESYFFTGAACAYFQIAVDTELDLRDNPDEWIEDDEQEENNAQ